MENPTRTIAPGDLIDGKYQIQELIHRGGMGEVWAATDLESNRTVAIKFLLPSYLEDDKAKIRFKREAKFTEPLDHSNICDVYESGTTEDGTAYLVMERYSGSPLAQVFKEEALSLNRLINIVDQVLSALRAAHGKSIVHRDLKPENIFVATIDGKEGVVKLLDFGLSKAVNRHSTMPLTMPGRSLGTPAYMSPEQVIDAVSVDHRSDLYALGVILYQGLTKTLPFGGDSPRDTFIQIVERRPIPPSELNPTVPPGLEKLVLKAMAKKPGDRFQSAKQFQKALSKAVSHPDAAEYEPPIEYSLSHEFAKPSSMSDAPPRRDGDRKEPSYITALVIVLIVLAIAFFATMVR